MEQHYFKSLILKLPLLIISLLFLAISFDVQAQTVTNPQVPFSQRTSSSTPAKTIYNVKGDFTMLGNTNLTLLNYANATNNEGNFMKYVDIDGDSSTLNSSMATLELSNGGENSAEQDCSNVLFAGLYWTGKSDDANETFIANRRISNNQLCPNTDYKLTVSRGGTSSNNYYPIYTFTGYTHSYAFSFTNATTGATIVTLIIDSATPVNIPVTYNSAGIATFTTPFTSNPSWGPTFTITSLVRNVSTNSSITQYQSTSSAGIVLSPSKNYDKKVISLKGPNASTYTTITAKPNGVNSDILFPRAAQSGIFVGYQEITDYVKTQGPGSYTVADIALIEGTNANPGLSGGWVMVVIYENPVMKSRAVTLFDGYAYVNGQLANGGEFGNIPISGFTTVGSGPVKMKLGVMAAEGDVAVVTSRTDYLAVQKLSNPLTPYDTTNYLTLTHTGKTVDNFFNSSIFPTGTRNPNYTNNTGVDFSMFTIPNDNNTVIGNNQTTTTFRFGSNYDVFTIFGFAMSVDAYIAEPNGEISVTSINNVPNPTVLNALPGQTINYSLSITNEGTEATNNTVISIPIPATAIFTTGATISYNTYYGFNPGTFPEYNTNTNTITWNLGTLPITAGHPEYIYADLSFTLNVTTDCEVILNAGCNPEVSLETGTITGTGATSGSSFTKYFFQGYDETSCHLPIDGSIKIAIDATSCFSSIAGQDRMVHCGGESVTLEAVAGTFGTWYIVSGPAGGGEIFSDITSPNSTFYSPNLGVYSLRWSTSCATTDEVIITFTPCNVVNFDGIDDYVNFKNNYNLNDGNFSIEAWVKPNATNDNTQTIISKRLGSDSTDGYDLRLINNLISFNWNNNSIIATHVINTNRWFHIAVTFDSTSYKLYIDGILENTASGGNPTPNSVDCILGAMAESNATPNNYYNGYTDELRMWNVPLTVDQIRQMMNQEITNDGNGNVKGVIVPKNISGLSWTNLAGYYQMNRASDISNGYLVDKSGNNSLINGKLRGIYVQEPDTAPLPYTSGANGSWETDVTWLNYLVWDVPNSIGVDGTTRIDWNIVKTTHDITSNGNKTVLGLFVSNNTLSAENDSKIEISHYLKLDGKIDLVGKSQLVQTAESDLDPTSSGSIEKDQQGQANKHNYNYWSSPVSVINGTDNNLDYNVAGVMKDGTKSSPQNINWIDGYDGLASSPISLARYWIYKFDNYASIYANWVPIGETGAVRVGQGFTLKGSGAASGSQNYTFVGKPNNGTITTNRVSPGQLLLTGNPYPSALDASAFINDNLNSIKGSTEGIDGTLYFWEHYPTNNTHVLRDYQGGYAVRNLIAGIAPISPALISGLGSSTRIPGRYIPVGQGFFVYGKSTAATNSEVIFNNAQRSFHKEDDAESNNVFKIITQNKTKQPNNNDDDPIEQDTYKKIRLGYNTQSNYHRQVLLGFIDDKATSGMDYGYDSYIFDVFPDDMYLLNGENQLVIEGEGYFDANASYPIGVKAAAEGKVSFILDDIENFETNQPIFVYDDETKLYHNIRNETFEINIPKGEFHSRFSLRFKDKTLGTNEQIKNENDIIILHSQNRNALVINNKLLDTTVQEVTLFNILGQAVAMWEVENQGQENIQLPIKKVSSGIYIAKIKTSTGVLSKKIIIK